MPIPKRRAPLKPKNPFVTILTKTPCATIQYFLPCRNEEPFRNGNPAAVPRLSKLRSSSWPRRLHFRTAPKFVLAFFVSRESVSLSSTPAAVGAFFFLELFALPAVADVGVGALDAPSLLLNVVETGVGACEGAAEEPGVCDSCCCRFANRLA